MMRIICKNPGFRRAGTAHPAVAEYPDNHFSPEQLAALKAEPMLTVVDMSAGAVSMETPREDKAKKGKD